MVPILDGTNYCIWSIQMGNFLRAKGLWLYVQGHVTGPADARPGRTAVQLIPPDANDVTEACEKQLN